MGRKGAFLIVIASCCMSLLRIPECESQEYESRQLQGIIDKDPLRGPLNGSSAEPSPLGSNLTSGLSGLRPRLVKRNSNSWRLYPAYSKSFSLKRGRLSHPQYSRFGSVIKTNYGSGHHRIGGFRRRQGSRHRSRGFGNFRNPIMFRG